MVRSILSPQIAVRHLIRRFRLGPIDFRLALQAVDRPQYAYGVKQAARLAARLGLPAVSVIEFGVATGEGLIKLEEYAAIFGKAFGVTVNVYGFDLGTGLPSSTDYRDLPYVWQGGFYRMDVDGLKSRLRAARLYLGDVRETVREFLASEAPPVGFISFDLDLYSSTTSALQIFDASDAAVLPRVLCYFDDITSNDHRLHCDRVGELRAILEFNQRSKEEIIAPLGVINSEILFPSVWMQQLYVYHRFSHGEYNTYIGDRPAAAIEAGERRRPAATVTAMPAR